MEKEEILAKIEEFKDKPIIVGLSDAGTVLCSGFDGRWLFTQGGFLVEVRTNVTDTAYRINAVSQMKYPYKISAVPFEIVNYVQTFIGDKPGDIADAIENLTLIGTSKTKDEVLTEMESNSVRKAHSPSGYLEDPHVAPGTDYGAFPGSMISTTKNGLPKYVKDTLT